MLPYRGATIRSLTGVSRSTVTDGKLDSGFHHLHTGGYTGGQDNDSGTDTDTDSGGFPPVNTKHTMVPNFFHSDTDEAGFLQGEHEGKPRSSQSIPHCQSHTVGPTLSVSHCQSHTVSLTLSVPHCQSHTVSPTMSVSHCQSHTVSLTLSVSHCQSHTISLTLSAQYQHNVSTMSLQCQHNVSTMSAQRQHNVNTMSAHVSTMSA